MTTFASVALFKRDGKTTFKLPRAEKPTSQQLARTAAFQHWKCIDKSKNLQTVFLVRVVNQTGIEIHSRPRNASSRKPWSVNTMFISEITEPHIQAALPIIGVNSDRAPQPLPDALVINGVRYIREI